MFKLYKSASLIIGIISCLNFQAKAQQSIIPDISYLFLEKLIATARQNYPRVKQLNINKDIAELNVKQQKLTWLDPLSASYFSTSNNQVLNFTDTRFLINGYQIGASINVGTFLQKPLSIKKSKSELLFANEIANEYALQLESEVKRRYFTYIQAFNNVKLFTKTLQDAEGMKNDMRIRFERGEVAFDNYSQSLITFSSISQSKIDSEASMLIAKAALEELTISRIEDIQ
jgi:outer membrane protein TolC